LEAKLEKLHSDQMNHIHLRNLRTLMELLEQVVKILYLLIHRHHHLLM
jgi:hypothetical protein